MLELYAQQIVQDIADIIGYEVLMTDRSGTIIGSSDPDRLGKRLFEAPIVIKNKKVYVLDEDEARKIPEAVEGVTYPIEDMTGEVIGAIAITGKPEEVSPVALMVKKHAELFIKERVVLGSVLEKERVLQTFMRELEAFDPRITDISLLERKARYFGYRKGFPHCLIWIRICNFPLVMEKLLRKLEDSTRGINVELALQTLKSRVNADIRGVFNGQGDISSPFAADDFVIIHELNVERKDLSLEMKRKCSHLLDSLSSWGMQALTVIGSPKDDLQGLSRSFHDADEILKDERLCVSEQKVFSLEDLRFEILLASARPDRKDEFLALKLDKLKIHRDWPEMRETILAWCDSSFSIKNASDTLHIHRNTLKYRLDKIQRVCSIDIKDFRALLELYCAIRMENFFS